MYKNKVKCSKKYIDKRGELLYLYLKKEVWHMNIVETIRSKTEQMTRSETSVATYVLEHMNDVAFFTLDELAEHTELSTTSVLRFCRRLGFTGFKPFQHAVRADLKASPDLMDKFHRTTDSQLEDSLLVRTVRQGIQCIEQTFRDLPNAQIEDTVRRIAKARRVYTFGMRESEALASYAYSRLLTVRGNVFMYRDGYSGNIETLLDITEEDVFLVFLFRRYTRQTLQLLEILKHKGIQVILVTSPPADTVARYAAVLLPCCVDAKGIKNSSLAPICLADYLCNAIAIVNQTDTLKRMQESESLFRYSETVDN